MNNITVNVFGPPKSGKSKVVSIIEKALEGLDVRVTEANDRDQARASVPSPETTNGQGALPASACSAFYCKNVSAGSRTQPPSFSGGCQQI